MSESQDKPPDETAVPERFRVDLAGAVLQGGLRVGHKIAEGGMGSIYLAEDTSLGRKVVVKVPHPRFLVEPGFQERLVREITELVRLEHPHVTRIVARGEHEGLPYFVLQYLGGGNLEDRLASEGHQTGDAVLRWLPVTARTLDFVHRRGILHRDVKPSNILFDEEGHVFLSDFGVAKAIGAEDGGLTATGVGIGSPRYMAPEQALGGDVGPEADQYGLASTLYEALAGASPFGEGTPVEILVRKSREDARHLRELAPDLPEGAAATVMRALARDPAERFTSCEAFATAFAEGLGVRAPSPTPIRGPVLLAGAAAVAVVVALLLVLLTGADPSPVTPSSATRSPVTLLHAGAEPRRPLRYMLSEGSRERMVFESAGVTEILYDGQVNAMAQPTFAVDADVTVESIGEDGTIGFSWRLTEAHFEESDPALDDVTRETLTSLVGIKANGMADAAGRTIDVAIANPDDVGPLAELMLGNLMLGVSELITPLPDEAIGVGARWEQTKTITQMGMRMTQATTYELLALEGYRLELRADSVLAAPRQTINAPESQIQLPQRLERLLGQTETELRVDLSQLVPRSFYSQSRGEFAQTMEASGEEFRKEGTFRSRIEMHRR